jgi:hypothetical protein
MRTITATLALAAVAGLADAKTIWAVDNNRRSGETSDRIIKFNSSTPNSVISVGITNVDTLFGGLDFDRAGNLYAYATTSAPGLYSINKTTGIATFIGTGGVAAGYTISDLSFNPSTNQMLALAVQTSAFSSIIYQINLNTGVATLVTTLTGAGRLEVGLASSASGRNYLMDVSSNRIFEIVGSTLTPLPALLGYDANFSQGMAIDWSDNGLWAIGAFNADPEPLFFDRGQLRTVNADGSTTLVGRIGPNDKLYQCGDIAFEPFAGCEADFNGDDQVDFFDYLDFAAAFNDEDLAADFNGDQQVDFFDYLDFAAAFDDCQ